MYPHPQLVPLQPHFQPTSLKLFTTAMSTNTNTANTAAPAAASTPAQVSASSNKSWERAWLIIVRIVAKQAYHAAYASQACKLFLWKKPRQ